MFYEVRFKLFLADLSMMQAVDTNPQVYLTVFVDISQHLIVLLAHKLLFNIHVLPAC